MFYLTTEYAEATWKNEMLKLVEPNEIDEKEFNDFIEEFESLGEELIPCTLDQKGLNFHNYIKLLNDYAVGKNLPEGWVPASSFFLIDDAGKIYGATNVRHKLTESLEAFGGLIGYGIRPSERNKGYGTLILKLTLEKAKKMGINKALITCSEDNIASAKVIQNNGGIFDSENEWKI